MQHNKSHCCNFIKHSKVAREEGLFAKEPQGQVARKEEMLAKEEGLFTRGCLQERWGMFVRDERTFVRDKGLFTRYCSQGRWECRGNTHEG